MQSRQHGAIIPSIPPSQPLFPNRSAAARILYSAVALATVWCLGCCAFEPLLSSLLGPAQSMAVRCSGDAATNASAVASFYEDSAPAVSAFGSGSDSAQTVCACTSCVAPAPMASTIARIAPLATQQPRAEASTPTSVEREPLHPPPQTAL